MDQTYSFGFYSVTYATQLQLPLYVIMSHFVAVNKYKSNKMAKIAIFRPLKNHVPNTAET